MSRKSKAYLIFSVVYWLLIGFGLFLFGFSFDKVPINSYGLKRNYFSSDIELSHYTSGLYYNQISYYFVEFPSSNVYLIDLELNVTNFNMETIGLTFTLVYQLNPDQLYNLYSSLSTNYEQYLIGQIKVLIYKYEGHYFKLFHEHSNRQSNSDSTKSHLKDINQFWPEAPYTRPSSVY